MRFDNQRFVLRAYTFEDTSVLIAEPAGFKPLCGFIYELSEYKYM